MILVGDIGGTHTRMALLSEKDGHLVLESERIYPSREHASLTEIVAQFMSGQSVRPDAACFGIAGPVLNGRAKVSNLGWIVDALQISRESSISPVWLINDLQAHAYGIPDLADTDLVVLNAGTPCPGNAAIIAAGTGLGEAGMYWDGAMYHPFPAEGGHADLAPSNELEWALYGYLAKKFGHVSCERVISGPGIKNVYDFLRDSKTEEEPAWLMEELDRAPDAAALISQYALEAKSPICEHALDIFVSMYGAEAGNVALRMMAVGGVFISGGIAGKTLAKMKGPRFMKAFLAKGRMTSLLESVPVKGIVNEHIGQFGAARYALMRQEKATQIRP
jgi:glucokinase